MKYGQYRKDRRAKGLICTAALELSTNQVTHFYSSQKNTREMIKLLTILIQKYKCERKIYFSWDTASWHASKALYEKVEEVNSERYRSNKYDSLSRACAFADRRPIPECN